jgi:hypothetical protein
MFRCEHCHKVVPPNTAENQFVVEYRIKKYRSRPHANKVSKGRKTNDVGDPGGVGKEIVREIALCPECARAAARAVEAAEAEAA